MAQNEYTERERTGEVWFILKTFICLENMIDKSERRFHNLMENECMTGMSVK